MPWRERTLPTTSLYFEDALADVISARIGMSDRPIQRLGPNAFISGSAAVVIRYARPRDIAFLERGGFDRIYWLIDDDLAALGDNDGLPPDYRRRLMVFNNGLAQRLMQLATHVVAPSERILAHYRRKTGLRLDPAQCYEPTPLVHHQRDDGLDIVFAATRSHIKDMEFLAPALADFLRKRPEVRLTTFLNGHVPRVLSGLANVVNLPAMDWARYRKFVARNRFHVAIAPSLDTPFNRARSVSRLHDHAAYGAAGLYSDIQPFADVVRHGESGLLLPNQPARWRDTLFELADDRPGLRRLAEGGQQLSRQIGDIRRVRRFWMRELGLLPAA